MQKGYFLKGEISSLPAREAELPLPWQDGRIRKQTMPHHTINEGFLKAEALFHTHRYDLSPDGLNSLRKYRRLPKRHLHRYVLSPDGLSLLTALEFLHP